MKIAWRFALVTLVSCLIITVPATRALAQKSESAGVAIQPFVVAASPEGAAAAPTPAAPAPQKTADQPDLGWAGGGWKPLKTVTAFTVSHSITLTLATLGYVHIPQRPVEAVIALSIVFVAAEILRGRQGHVGITARAPWLVALMFGLMPGLGFASGLKDAGLPDGHIPTALLFFSIGVETGHFIFIGFVLSLFALMLRAASKLPSVNQQGLAILELLPPYAIGSVAMFWVIQRIAAFRG